jgi:hypothetical protein
MTTAEHRSRSVGGVFSLATKAAAIKKLVVIPQSLTGW